MISEDVFDFQIVIEDIVLRVCKFQINFGFIYGYVEILQKMLVLYFYMKIEIKMMVIFLG